MPQTVTQRLERNSCVLSGFWDSGISGSGEHERSSNGRCGAQVVESWLITVGLSSIKPIETLNASRGGLRRSKPWNLLSLGRKHRYRTRWNGYFESLPLPTTAWCQSLPVLFVTNTTVKTSCPDVVQRCSLKDMSALVVIDRRLVVTASDFAVASYA